MAQRVGAVAQHALAFAKNQAERQVRFRVVARRYVVDRVVGEEIRPALDVAALEIRRVLVVELLDLQARFAESGAGRERRGDEFWGCRHLRTPWSFGSSGTWRESRAR